MAEDEGRGQPATESDQEVDEETQQRVLMHVVNQLQAGVDRTTIARGLEDQGMERQDAHGLVNAVHADMLQTIESERVSSGALFGAVAGAVVAAILGGIIWGQIVLWTDYEIGWMAIGMGAVTGFAALVVSGGKRGLLIQVVAVGAALFGVAFGKYFIYVTLVRENLMPAGSPSRFSLLFEEAMVQAFIEDASLVFGFFDLLWVALAVYTAWRIPKGVGLRLPKPGIMG